MSEFVRKWTPELITQGLGDNITAYFRAAYALNIQNIEHLIQNSLVDINLVQNFVHIKVNKENLVEEHVHQIFGSARPGKVICQIFERIDTITESEVKVIIHLLKFLLRSGLVLEDVIYDRKNNKFSAEQSDYFWFTILRKLYMFSCDPAKNESYQTSYKCLASFLEENLHKGIELYGQIARSARMFLAVEESDYSTVENLLETFKSPHHFHAYMRITPGGKIFPVWTYYEHHILITPIALALRRRDLRMVSLLFTSTWGKQPLFSLFSANTSENITFQRNMNISLYLDIMREDQHFLENPDMPDLNIDFLCKNCVKIESSKHVAQIFREFENSCFPAAQNAINKSDQFCLQSLKETYVISTSDIIGQKDIDNQWINKLHFEKSLVLISLENKDLKMLEYLKKKDFDITDLGCVSKYPTSSKEKNKMLLWYFIIKHHLENDNYLFVNNFSKMPDIWNGPALVGCLYMAARRRDYQTMDLVAKYFESSWLTGPKYLGLTAHGLLVKFGLEKEAAILLANIGPQFTDESERDIEKKLDSAKSLEDFKNLIEANLHWLTKGFEQNTSLVMIFVNSSNFSMDKFEYLVKEKEVDIRMVRNGGTFLDLLLKKLKCCEKISVAERLLEVVKNEETQNIIQTLPNFLLDMSIQILNSSSSTRSILIECFALVINHSSQSLETIFSPKKEDNSILRVIHNDSELFNICAERAFQLIGKEDNPLPALVNILKLHVRSIFPIEYETTTINSESKEKMLALFKFFLENLRLEEKRQNAGYSTPLEYWKDRYGMTFMMRLLGDNTDNPWVDLLVKEILENNFFSEEYLHSKAHIDLGPQFDIQHFLGISSINKKKNSVISKDQFIKLKKVKILNTITGKYEQIPSSKPDQIKMISKVKVHFNEDDGPDGLKRMMVTVKESETKTLKTVSEEIEYDNGQDKKLDVDDELFGLEAISLDGNESSMESRIEPDLDLPEDTSRVLIDRWNLGQEGVRDRIVEAEHFDTNSIVSDENLTFQTKVNKYKYAQSASTRFMETHSDIEAPSQNYAKNTTFLLMACRSNKWEIVETVLNVASDLIDVNYKDANGSNALHLAIKAEEQEICMKMIHKVDKHALKTEVNSDNKNALRLVTDVLKKGVKFDIVEKKILEKTGQKQNHFMNSQIMVDKTKIQTLQLFGMSCGFTFECLGPPVWTCIGESCNVVVTLEEGLILDDPNHYIRHTCSTRARVKYRNGKV